MLPLFTNRKLRMCFRLVPQSTILVDHEWPWMLCKMCIFWSTTRKCECSRNVAPMDASVHSQSIASKSWQLHAVTLWQSTALLLYFVVILLYLLSGRNALVKAISPIAAHFSVMWSDICLSVVCRTCALCLDCLTDIYMPFGRYWYTCRVLWHVVLDGVPDPQGKGYLGSWTPPPAKTCNCLFVIHAGGTTDQQFCILPITLVTCLAQWSSG